MFVEGDEPSPPDVCRMFQQYMGVAPRIGGKPENRWWKFHEKPYEQMDDLGCFPPIFGNTHICIDAWMHVYYIMNSCLNVWIYQFIYQTTQERPYSTSPDCPKNSMLEDLFFHVHLLYFCGWGLPKLFFVCLKNELEQLEQWSKPWLVSS